MGMIEYSRYHVGTILNLVLTVPKWMIYLYYTNPSHEVLLSFVWLKFLSFGWDTDMRRIRSDKNLSFGMPKAPPRQYPRNTQAPKLGDAPDGIPSFVFNIIGISYLELYFYSSHNMIFAWSVILFCCSLLGVIYNLVFNKKFEELP